MFFCKFLDMLGSCFVQSLKLQSPSSEILETEKIQPVQKRICRVMNHACGD